MPTSVELLPPDSQSHPVDLDALRTHLQAMTDAELIAFGKQMRSLVYPLRYDGDGKPMVTSFAISLAEARAEWRRYPKVTVVTARRTPRVFDYPRIQGVKR